MTNNIGLIVRDAFTEAVKKMEDEGVSLSKLLAEELASNPRETLRAISPFVHKEVEVRNAPSSVEHFSDEELMQIVRQAEEVTENI